MSQLFLGMRATGEYAIIPTTYGSRELLENKRYYKRKSDMLDSTPFSTIESENIETPIRTQESIIDTQFLSPLPYYNTNAIAPQFTTNYIPSQPDTYPKQKKIRSSTVRDIAEALGNINKTAQDLSISKVQQAITILQEEYEQTYITEDMILAMSIFESTIKAEMFIVMKRGCIRDGWLERELEKLRT